MSAPSSLSVTETQLELPPSRPAPVPATCGEYELGALLGSGGMGDVYLAHHVVTGQVVAIKVLKREYANEPGCVERFRREVVHASALCGPHSVRVHEHGIASNGRPFIAMDLLTGVDLEVLLERGPLAPREAVRWTLQACEAVAEAHAHGIIHRDLKPSNLFLAETPTEPILKVLDYGISRAATNSPRLTATQGAIGTPMYMSPEQAKNSKAIDHRTDVWSLGVILYELLTGRAPFDGESFTEIAVQICTGAPPPPSSLRDGIPAELDRIVLWALEKDPSARPSGVAALAAALRDCWLPSKDHKSARSVRRGPRGPVASSLAVFVGSVFAGAVLALGGSPLRADTTEPSEIEDAVVVTAGLGVGVRNAAEPAVVTVAPGRTCGDSGPSALSREVAVQSVPRGPVPVGRPVGTTAMGRSRPKFDERR